MAEKALLLHPSPRGKPHAPSRGVIIVITPHTTRSLPRERTNFGEFADERPIPPSELESACLLFFTRNALNTISEKKHEKSLQLCWATIHWPGMPGHSAFCQSSSTLVVQPYKAM